MEIKEFKVRITLTEPMLGTVPKNKDIYKSYIESKKPTGIDEEESETVEQIEEKGWTGFHSDEQGLFIYDYMIRGFLKNAGNNLKEAIGVKAVKSKIDNFVFVFPRRIHMDKPAPDGMVERPLRAMTAQGPRVSLARSDYVDAGTVVNFTVKIVPHKGNELSEKVIKSLFDYGQFCGLGQFRNGSYGRFTVEFL